MSLFTQEGKITYSISSKCNIDCTYCYTNKESHGFQYIDIDFAKVATKDFFASSNSRRLRFFGSGEPTVRIDLIKRIYEYAQSISGVTPVSAEIQTNGVYSTSTGDWLNENMDIIYISTDGPDWVQDELRSTSDSKTTSQLVRKTINRAVDASKAKVCIRSTISKQNTLS